MKFTESKHTPFCFIMIPSFRLYEKLRTFDSSSVQVGTVAFATETSNVLIIWSNLIRIVQ